MYCTNGNGNNSGSMQNNIQHQLLNEGFNKTSEAINKTFETVWEVVIEQRFARRIRYFLQSNFGILYSCTGRVIYLCFVGGLALGEGLIFYGNYWDFICDYGYMDAHVRV